MKNKQENSKRRNLIWRYIFAASVILLGIVLSHFKIGNEFFGFSSVSLWLIYVGFIMIIIISLQALYKKKRIVDERMEFIASKSSRITFIGIILFSFTIMIIDGIKPIDFPYSYFMSYFICGIVLLYVISYKILLRFN
jgi:uncharacterized membrane protein